MAKNGRGCQKLTVNRQLCVNVLTRKEQVVNLKKCT